MARYEGFTCDQCGQVRPVTDRTLYTQRFEGPFIDHERTLDLCPACLDKFDLDLDEGMKPIRRRAKKGDRETLV